MRARWLTALCLPSLFTASATPSQSPNATPSVWPQHTVAAVGFTDVPVAAPGGEVAYGIVPADEDEGVWGRLEGVNLTTHKILHGPEVFEYAAQIVRVGPTLGVLEPTLESVGPSGQASGPPLASFWTLHRIEPGTARLSVGNYLRALGKTVGLPPVASIVDASVGGLWFAHPGRLSLIDPATASVLRAIPAPAGPINAIAPSPDGRTLYVTVEPQSSAVRLYELDASTGRVLAKRTLEAGVPFGAVDVATPAGVWVSQSGGMSTHWVTLFSAQRLEPMTAEPASPTIPGQAPPVDGYAVTVLDGVGWTETASTMSCISPGGEVLATGSLPMVPGAGSAIVVPFLVQGRTLYAARDPSSGAGSGDVVAITPPPACFSRAS